MFFLTHDVYCLQDRRCVRHHTEPVDGELQTADSFQFSGTLPASTGDNKYMENMTPGYTGKHSHTRTLAVVYITLSVIVNVNLSRF